MALADDMAESSKSIIPFLPRPLKYFILLIIFANFRSWPFVWHCKSCSIPRNHASNTNGDCLVKVFRPVIRIRLYQLYLKLTQQPRKIQQEYKESIAPIGENPLECQTVYDTWAGKNIHRLPRPFTCINVQNRQVQMTATTICIYPTRRIPRFLMVLASS